MGAKQHPAGRKTPIRVELPIGQPFVTLGVTLGPTGVPTLVLEGIPADLRGLFAVGAEAVERADREGR